MLHLTDEIFFIFSLNKMINKLGIEEVFSKL